MKIRLLIKKAAILKLFCFLGITIFIVMNVNAKNHMSPTRMHTKQISADTNVPGAVYPVLYANLMSGDPTNLSLMDGVATVFNNSFSAAVDVNDAMKLWNFGENIALIRHDTALAIEFRPVPKQKDTVFLRLYLSQQPHTLKFFTQNFTTLLPMQAWLVDNYRNTTTQVNLYDTVLYNFTPTPDTNSYRNRFMLVLNRQFTAKPEAITKVVNQNNPGVMGIASRNDTETKGNVSIYPNPVVSENALLRFTNMPKDIYTVAVYNIKGQQLTSFVIPHNGGNAIYPLQTNIGWFNGIYVIRIARNSFGTPIKLQMEIRR